MSIVFVNKIMMLNGCDYFVAWGGEMHWMG